MKKRIVVWISALALLLTALAGCAEETEQSTNIEETKPKFVTFRAEIIELNGDIALVEPLEDEDELKSSDRITFSVKELADIDAEPGCIVEITYDGLIRETYPASIDAGSWTLIECSELESELQYTYAKPVIYLYPQEETAVSVLLDLQGELTCTYPAYKGGWQITAAPDGTLTDKAGQTYNYLYWEGTSGAEYDFSKGFCVKGEDTAAFLEEALAELGLDRREANEFIVYWLPLMEQNPYNIISFQTDNYTDAAKLQVFPEPDTVIRVFMAWYAADIYTQIETQALTAPERTGFTVVEWGGTQIK